MVRRVGPVLFAAVLLVTACAPSAVPPPPPGDRTVARTLTPLFPGTPTLGPPDLTDDGPGSLLSVAPMSGSTDLEDINAAYMRVVYRSTSGVDGTPTEVSGVVAIPAGTPPKGGWPVVSFGHGTTGILNKCAPSLFGTLPGSGPMIGPILSSGFVVAMTDYQGLGVQGYYHPFLDAKTFGYNMIDAVRAARRVGVDVSDRWVAFGHSLGGLAAWAAADEAGTYGKGLDLLGTLAMAPAADMSGMADAAQNGTLTADQRVALVFVLQSLSWSHPDLDLARYRSGYTAAHWDEILDCIPTNLDDIMRVRQQMTNADLKPETPADTARLRDLLEQIAVPQNRATGPLRVVYGTEDTLVDQPWFERALTRSCAQGDAIEIDKKIGQGHSDLDSAFGLSWLQDRLDGISVPNNCPAPS
jgi:pimeloyl-ACP methyl ester carboxylesterase